MDKIIAPTKSKMLITSAFVACATLLTLPLPSCLGGSGTALATDSVNFERTWTLDEPQAIDPLGGRSSFKAKIDYPNRAANAESLPALNDSVCAWLSLQLLPSSEKPVLNKSVLDMASEVFFGETDGNEWGMDYAIEAHKIYDDDHYISYELTRYSYTGGAHGDYNVQGQTFHKATGQPVEWRHFKQDDNLRKALTSQLAIDMKFEDDQHKLDELVLDKESMELPDGSFALPLPMNVPYLTTKGWVFIYRPMEVLPRVYGAPATCLEAGKVQVAE